VLVATGALLTYARYRSANEQQRLVVNNYETISLMRQALIVLQDTEIGQRAYLLTGDLANLEPYERARLRLDPIVRQLEAAIGDDSEALRQVAEFRTAASEKLSELNATIVAYQLYGRDAVMPRNAGRAITDRIRQIADAFVEGQRLVLSSRLAALRSEQEQADLAGVLVLSGAFACLVVGMYLIVRGGSRLEQAQQQLTARTQLLQTTLETLQDPIFVLDSQTTSWPGTAPSRGLPDGIRRVSRCWAASSCCPNAIPPPGRCCSRSASVMPSATRSSRRGSSTRASTMRCRAARCRAAARSCASSTSPRSCVTRRHCARARRWRR
jgi:CHASE3 domain sensor protein